MLPDFTQNEFLIIAHRGASYDAPENTMPAFRDALRMRANMIELDVQLTADGVPVVFHDDTLDKKTDGRGPVHQHTLQEIKQLDAGRWFARRYKGTQIPELEEVLHWAKGKIPVNIEIKPEAVSGKNGVIEKRISELVSNLQMEDQVVVSSFAYEAVLSVKKILPEVKTGLLYNRKSGKTHNFTGLLKEYKADYLHCRWREINRRQADELKRAGVPFFIYTVNSLFWAKKLKKMGASGIFTDKPGFMRYTFEEQQKEIH